MEQIRALRNKKDKIAGLLSMLLVELREMDDLISKYEEEARNREQELWTLRETNKLMRRQVKKLEGGEKSEKKNRNVNLSYIMYTYFFDNKANKFSTI